MILSRISWGAALIVALSLFMSITAWADVYRYVDKNGVWHFTNIKTDRRYKGYPEDTDRIY